MNVEKPNGTLDADIKIKINRMRTQLNNTGRSIIFIQ